MPLRSRVLKGDSLMAQRLFVLKCKGWYFHGFRPGGKPVFNPTVKGAQRGGTKYAMYQGKQLAQKLNCAIQVENW